MLKNRSRVAMQAAMLLAAFAAVPATAQQGVPKLRKKGETYPPRWPNEPERKTELQREIDEWNAAVERRKAEKKLGRLA